jgi:hypothetical protein
VARIDPGLGLAAAFFHHPVASRFEFSAVSFNTREEMIPDLEKLTVDNVSFHFGDLLVEARDRLMMKRKAC